MTKKKYYLVYKTTCLLNGKIYIGKHQTDNLDDGYLGSGKLLKRAIKKYGEQNFKREILFECSTKGEMDAKEAELVNEEFLKRDDIYNIKLGGQGGWDYLNSQISPYRPGSTARKLACSKASCVAHIRMKEQGISPTQVHLDRLSDEEQMRFRKHVSETVKQFHNEHPNYFSGENNPRFGKKNSPQHRRAISKAMRTDHNFMRNAHHYVNYELEQNIILHDDVIPPGFEPGYCIDFNKRKDRLLKQKINEEHRHIRELEIEHKKHIRDQQKQIRYQKQLDDVEAKKRKLKEMQECYLKYGWESMIKLFNYQYTLQAFSQQYVKYFGIGISGRRRFKRTKTI